MGCSNSRLHDLPAVALCHDRCNFIAESIHHLSQLSLSNRSFMLSLNRISKSLLNLSPYISHPKPATSLSLPDQDSESSLPPENTRPDSQSGTFYDRIRSKSPPPPPAPSNTSPWDFLNLFDTYDRYESSYCYSLNDKEVGLEATRVSEEKDVRSEGCGEEEEDFGVVKEIEALLYRASESGGELSKMLEVGKFNIPLKNAAPQDEGLGVDCGTLYSAMGKLCMWEKKLYEEVKTEEKMRMIHEKKTKQLQYMNEKGTTANKVESTRTTLSNLCIKIRISIQVIDRISLRINKLRDEELSPHVDKLIHGLLTMWKELLECHKNLSQVMAESKQFGSIALDQKLSDTHLESIVQLKVDMQNWYLGFSNWMDSQKGFAKALNSWLRKCIFQEPVGPVCPLSVDGSPIFVIFSRWSQAMEKISENEVIEAMQALIVSLNQLSERFLSRSNMDLHERMLSDKDLERRIKALEKEDQKMAKLMQVWEKKMLLASGDGSNGVVYNKILHSIEVPNTIWLHSGLRRIFDSVEKLADESVRAYDGLLHVCDEDDHTQENSEAP